MIDHRSTLTTFRDFQPTAVDYRGLGSEDQPDWLVCPVTDNRDSGHLDSSNWAAQLEALEEANPDGNDYEVHKFGHWGPGWFRIAVVRPGSKAHEAAVKLELRLADCPVLNEEDFSEREYEETLERLAETIRDIERETDSNDAEEWDCEALASEVFGELHSGASELSSRLREQVTEALTGLGYLEA